MKCYVQSTFNCSAHQAWETVQTSALLSEVMRPLIRMKPVDGGTFPERWRQGAEVRCRLYLFGVLYLGTRSLFFERIDSLARAIQTREHDQLVRRWDHEIRVESAPNGRTRYSDRIEIEAGPLTAWVWLFAQLFYRHRQRRWRRVARRLADVAAA